MTDALIKDVRSKLHQVHKGLSDHARGCQGRNYSCDCGYDEEVQELCGKAADMLEQPGDAEREELARLRLLHAGQKAHEKALQQELTEYGVPEDWPEYQELRAKLIAQGNNCLDEKPSAQNRLQYFFKNRHPVGTVVDIPSIIRGAKLPEGYFWGREAMEHFNFAKECAAREVEAALNVSQPGGK